MSPKPTIMAIAADTLRAGGWPEDAIVLDEMGAASLSPRWSAMLAWSPRGELQGQGWTATIQLRCVPVAISTGRTAERALSAATVAAARRVGAGEGDALGGDHV